MTLPFRRPDQLLVILYDCDAPVWSRVKKRDSDSLISGSRHQKTLLKIRSPQNADYFVVSSQDVVEFEWDHSI